MLKGSYTVEAVFLFPILIFLMAFLFRISIEQYETVVDASKDVTAVMEMDNRSLFLWAEILEKATGEKRSVGIGGESDNGN